MLPAIDLAVLRAPISISDTVLGHLALLDTLGEPDWASLGLASAIVGCFLIANSILFEHPRRLVRQYFGKGEGRLRSVREYVYNRVQTTLGFTFLLGGFGLQLVGRHQALSAQGGMAPPLPMAWVGVIVVVAIGLLCSGWWWSLWAFRRYVREYFLDQPPSLENDPAMARELGELFGIEPESDDTVESYVSRVREKVGLEPGRDLAPPASTAFAAGAVEPPGDELP